MSIGGVTSCCDCGVACVRYACLCDVTSCCECEVAFMLCSCLRGFSLCMVAVITCGVDFLCCVVFPVYVSVALVISWCSCFVLVLLSFCPPSLFSCCFSTFLSEISVVNVSILFGKICGSVICVSC